LIGVIILPWQQVNNKKLQQKKKDKRENALKFGACFGETPYKIRAYAQS
jgi:hypothetical protein